MKMHHILPFLEIQLLNMINVTCVAKGKRYSMLPVLKPGFFGLSFLIGGTPKTEINLDKNEII